MGLRFPLGPAHYGRMADDPAFSRGSEILLLEDDAPLRKRLSAFLRQLGAEVTEAARIDEARRLLHAVSFEFAIVDLHLPDGEVLSLLREGAFSENTGVIVMTAFGGIQKAVEAIRLGAGDYLAKPFEPEELSLALARCRNSHRATRREQHVAQNSVASATSFFFGHSLAKIRTQLDAILASDRRLKHHLPPMLIEGETGTGKSVLARWIHGEGPRREMPFIAVNCATLAENVIESELFGHERGAFTDAKSARIGLFEAADGGTLFLDEIGTLSSSAQAKLLTAIEDGAIRRLGGTREIHVDVRVLAASNRPLHEMVRDGHFRDDLFHRLNLLAITLPPLRERGGDIVAMARHLVAKLSAQHRIKNLTLTAEGESRLLAQPWPGNVRELSHVIEREIIFGGGAPLDFAGLGAALPHANHAWRNPAWQLPANGFSLDKMIEEFIADVLREEEGNVSAAARRLGVTRDFIRYRLGERKTDSPHLQ